MNICEFWPGLIPSISHAKLDIWYKNLLDVMKVKCSPEFWKDDEKIVFGANIRDAKERANGNGKLGWILSDA